MGSDLAELKANLAKYKKGKHGKGLDDIDIEQLDWVKCLQSLPLMINVCFRSKITKKLKLSQFLFMKPHSNFLFLLA